MAEDLYVVVGASGHVGSGAARILLEQKKKVRAIARHPAPLEALKQLGAEVALGSVEDEAFLKEAFRGATAAFVLIPPNLGLQGGFRDWQRKVGENQARALEANRVPYVLSLSSIGADLPEGNGPVAGLHDLEQRLNRIPGVNALHLRPGYFFENHLGSIGMIKSLGFYAGGFRPDLPVAQVATADIAQVAGRKLAALDWKGQSFLELQGPKLITMVEVARALGTAIGNPDLAYRQLPYEDVRKGLAGIGIPDEMAGKFVEMMQGFNEGRLAPLQKRSVETTTPTTIEEFARSTYAPAYRGESR